MKHLALLLVLLFAATSTHAQLRERYPEGLWKVMGKSESGNLQSVILSDGNTMKYVNLPTHQGRTHRSGVFWRLQLGREYLFPDVITKPPSDPHPYLEERLHDLTSRAPFRAMVTDKQVTDTTVSLKLYCPDGRAFDFRHRGTEGHDEAVRLVEPVRRDEIYEFPDILLPRTVEQRTTEPEQVQPQTKTTAGVYATAPEASSDDPLRQYLGEWRGVLYTTEGTFIAMTCVLRADGKGLWREIVFDDSSAEPPMLDVAVLTHDPQTGLCVASNPRDPRQPPVQSTWDETTRSFTTRLPSRHAGHTRTNTATFKSKDMIEWETVETDSAGETISSTKGCYMRLVVPIEVPNANPEAIFPSPRPPPEMPATDLLALRKLPPFRAKVCERRITEDEITIEFGNPPKFSIPLFQRRSDCTPLEWAKAKTLAGRLEKGITHEFPTVLTDDYQPSFRPRQPSDTMKPLESFVGEWRHHHTETNEQPKELEFTVSYFWNHDGTGLWREPDVTPWNPRDMTKDCLITFDPVLKRYVESASPTMYVSRSVANGKETIQTHMSVPPGTPAIDASWDEATGVYSWQGTNGTHVFKGTRRFVNPDRIEWESHALDKDGNVLRKSSGHYERIKP